MNRAGLKNIPIGLRNELGLVSRPRCGGVLILLVTMLAGCGGDTSSRTSCSFSSDCALGALCIDGFCETGADAAIGAATSVDAGMTAIRISPVIAILESLEGAAVSQAFEIIAQDPDGTERTLPIALWSLEHLRLGDIDADGVFHGFGHAGGEVRVEAEVMVDGRPRIASATIEVRVMRTLIEEGLATDIAETFPSPGGAAPTPRATPEFLYPLDGAVMPANVSPPTIQWNPVGSVDDIFRIRLQKPHATVTAYLRSATGFTHSWRVPGTLWQSMADSDRDATITIEVDRLDVASGLVDHGPAARHLRLAHGSVFGAVYYEHRTPGIPPRIHRINPATGEQDVVIPNPPPNADGTRCIGCHTLSPDGRYLWANTGAGQKTTYDLSTDLSADPPPSRYPLGPANLEVASFDPTGRWLVGGSHVMGGLNIFDAMDGSLIETEGLPASDVNYPAWSPDGSALAFVGNVQVAPAGHPEPGHPIAGDLFIQPVLSDGPTFGAFARIHEAASLASMPEGGTSDTHPSWSPDSRHIAFQHGVGVFTHVVRNPGALYLSSRDGTLVTRLDNASRGADGISSFWPTFSPYTTNERDGHHYYWMAFYSRSDYGNALAGTQGSDRRQLWVTAIDANPVAGTDPSFVPYWLPGQGTHTSNFSAFWAPAPCRSAGVGCSVSAECCSERCVDDGSGALTCGTPPPEECRIAGQTCGGGDCCGALTCVGNACIEAPI